MIKTQNPHVGCSVGALGERNPTKGGLNPCRGTSPHHIPPPTWLAHPPLGCPTPTLCWVELGDKQEGKGKGLGWGGNGMGGTWHFMLGVLCHVACHGHKPSPYPHSHHSHFCSQTCTTLGGQAKPSKHTPTNYLG